MSVANEMRAAPIWTQSPGEELANSVSHGIGLVAAVIGAPILLLAAFQHGRAGFFIGTIIFTVTMLLVYLGSTLYHAWPQTRAKSLLRVLDHAAIFLLIAGTYTPFALGPLRDKGGLTMLGTVWALAILGVLMKAARGPSHHPKLAMSLYLGTGWLGLVVIRPLALAIPFSGLLWLLAGGIAYTTGVLFYANKRLRYGHFVWHLFVLAGTSCHFLAVLSCTA
jgi:hemolysin III